jgi:hypothetical protein
LFTTFTIRGRAGDTFLHPNAHVYAKMALNIQKKLSAAGVGGKKPDMERKRKRSESSSSSTSTSQQHPSNSSGNLPQQARGYSHPQGRGLRGQSRGRGYYRAWMATPHTAATAATLATTAIAVVGASSTGLAHEAMPNRGPGAPLEAATGLAGRPSYGQSILSFFMSHCSHLFLWICSIA